MTNQASEPVAEEVSAPTGSAPPSLEGVVWRLDPLGSTITSTWERHAPALAQMDPGSIYFYADLTEVDLVRNDEETAQKVFRSLASVGLTEGQIIAAVNKMQHEGILFRESAI